MYQHGGFTKRGKIPGPASRALYSSIKMKRPQASLLSPSTTTATTSKGINTNKGSLTFASAITDCWNNTSNNSSSSSSNNYSGNFIFSSSSSSSTNQNQTRMSCLFCCNLVLIPAPSSIENKSDKKRSRMLKNLCFHLQISSKYIPEKCPKRIFPFCKMCQEFVKQLWDFQGMLDKIRLKMSKIVTTIERTVVDGEILNPNVDRNLSKQQQIIMKLRDMILQGYRNKLLVKKKLRDNLVLGNPIGDYNSTSSLKLEMNNDDNNYFDGRTFNSSFGRSSSPCERSQETVDLTILGDQDIIEEFEDIDEIEVPEDPSSSLTAPANNNSMEIVARYEDEESDHDDDDVLDEDNELVVDHPENEHHQDQENDSYMRTGSNLNQAAGQCQYNENTLVISNIHGSDGTSFTAEPPSLVQIKEELHNNDDSTRQEDDEEIDVEGGGEVSSDNEDDIYMLEPRKRRLLFDGVEIYKCTGSKKGVEYLQCSICSHTLEIPKRATRGDVSAYTRLKIHIQTAHPLALPVRTPPPSSKQRSHGYGCRLCDDNSSEEHKQAHPHPSKQENIRECDVCGRPIKNGSECNLLLHKFSHKNDEEKKAAVSATDKGTYNVILSKQKKIKRVRKTKMRRRRTKTNLDGKGSQMNSKGFICKFCNREFIRQCYLTLHMRVHSSEKRWPGMNEQDSGEDSEDQEFTGESEPPVLQPQQVPVITYPSAQKKNDCPSTSTTAAPRDIVRLVERNERESGIGFASFRAADPSSSSAPLLKREVVG